MSKVKGLTDTNEEIAEIKSRMVKNAREAILVVDQSKFDHTALMNNIQLKDINRIITDSPVNETWQGIFEANDVEVITAG